MLKVSGLTVGYGGGPVLSKISFACGDGEILGIVGANGVGKTTLLRTLSGLKRGSGSITWDETELTRKSPRAIVNIGISHVPEGRELFAPMTVDENIQVGGFRDLRRNRRRFTENRDLAWSLFPVLAERRGQQAGALSGGEQQMLAIARALMQSPKLLLMDEPSLGLAPIVIDKIYDSLVKICQTGLSMIVVEANPERVAQSAHRLITLSGGQIVTVQAASDVTRAEQRKALFGTGGVLPGARGRGRRHHRRARLPAREPAGGQPERPEMSRRAPEGHP
jgi:branched-chain amino acid transport system ATP-binding protein